MPIQFEKGSSQFWIGKHLLGVLTILKKDWDFCCRSSRNAIEKSKNDRLVTIASYTTLELRIGDSVKLSPFVPSCPE